MRRRDLSFIVLVAAALTAARSYAAVVWTWSDGSGLSAQAVFSQPAANVLRVDLVNTSTALPVALGGASANSNQILTYVSFDLPGGLTITGGSATLGTGAATVNFDNVVSQLGAGADVSPEWGFGNDGGTISLRPSFATSNESHSTRFTATGNLDGTTGLDGPQGGLVATPPVVAMGGLGAITGHLLLDLTLSDALNFAQFDPSNAIIMFGSDAYFIGDPTPSGGPPIQEVPESGMMALMLVGGAGLMLGGRKKAIPVFLRIRK